MAGHSEKQSSTPYLQAVHNRAAFTTVVFLLPLVHLANELQEGALGHWRVPVHWPAQELELLHHPISILGLERVRRQLRSGKKTGIICFTEFQGADASYLVFSSKQGIIKRGLPANNKRGCFWPES